MISYVLVGIRSAAISLREEDVYKERALEGLKMPDLPKSASEVKSFRRKFLSTFGSIDRTANSAIANFLKPTFMLGGNVERLIPATTSERFG